MTNKGQAVLEVMSVTVVVMIVTGCSLGLIYWSALRMYTSYYLYEGLVCRVHSAPTSCEEKLRHRMQKFPMAQIRHLQMQQKQSGKSFKIEGSIEVQNPVCRSCKTLSLRDSIYVPKNF